MDPLSALLGAFRLDVEIFHNAQYCGLWALDTSGAGFVSFHMVTYGQCVVRSPFLDAPEVLSAGDIVVFPHDAKHVMEASHYCQVELNSSISKDYEAGLQSDSVGLLCGYFKLSQSHSNLLLNALPQVMLKKCSGQSSATQSIALLNFMREEAISKQTGSQTVINRLTESLFVMLIREHIAEYEASSNGGGFLAALSDARISKALDAIYSKPEHSWTVEQLASKAAMSRSLFAERFKELLGESPMAHLTRWRMQQAWNWLSEDKISILEAAERTGYETEASFSKVFKRITGDTPGKVRSL